MKSDIEYFYNIKLDSFNQIRDYYAFELNLDKYYFCPFKRPLEDFEDLLKVSNELENKNILCHKFMLNKDKKYITTINNQNYILLRIRINEAEEIDLFEIEKIQNNLILNSEKSKLYRNNWGKLWSEKIDYFEYQITQLGKEKELILNTFSYYIGLAENAISYVNNTVENYTPSYKLTLSHKRIYYPNYALNYYNPLSFIFDLRIRDIAEYVKSAFFNNINIINDLEAYFKKANLSNYEYRLLYARLLYPSYYFDLYEEVMNHQKSEQEILKIINLVDEYELFLKNVYLLISKYSPIDSIEWIMKKEA